MNDGRLSVRERNKQETTRRIHNIAATMALKNGLLDTKVEAIAEAAGVSKRTFFNYFASKEDAVLGVQQPVLRSEVIERFTTRDDDLLTRVVWMFVDVARTVMVADTIKRHKQLRQHFPELLGRFKASMMQVEGVVRPAVASACPKVSDQEVSIILSVAGAIIRYTYGFDAELTDASIGKSLKQFKVTLQRSL